MDNHRNDFGDEPGPLGELRRAACAARATNGDSSLSQTFVVPASGGTLSFWYNITCPDTVTYDWARVTRKDKTSNTTATLLPLHDHLTSAQKSWHRRTPYRTPESWVFASPAKRGKGPYWGQQLLRHHIRTVAQRLGITKRIGWHTFRRTYTTLLRSRVRN